MNSTVVRPTTNTINKTKKKCFSTDNLKKRGLFVERNAVSSLLEEKDATNEQPTRKAPPRPRPGQKKFMSSVLTILSKSTASTQYPDVTEDKVRKPKPRRPKNCKTEAENSKILYKSSVLNKNVVSDEDFVILQSKRNIAQTPSNYSEATNVKLSEVEYSEKDNSIYKEVLEGKKYNNNNESTDTEMGKNDDKLCNLFVDLLLESTFNINNIQTEHENQIRRNDSHTILEINEDVAKKLELKADVKEEHYTEITDKIDLDLDYYSNKDKPLNIKLSNTIKPNIKVKYFRAKKSKTVPKSKSFEAKNPFAKSKKKNLLNMLKERLELDITYEEPRSLFEALKVMAKNKQRLEMTPELGEVTRKFADDRNPKCMLKRRKLFPNRKRKTTKTSPEQVIERPAPKKVEKKIYKSIPSYRSVEVYGYNYEAEKVKSVPKLTIFAYHTPSDSNFNYYT